MMSKRSGASITPFLTFKGKAEEAVRFYSSTFDSAELLILERYGANEMGAEGSVRMAIFALKGQRFMCIDSIVPHEHTFTPSVSFFVECDSVDEIDRLFTALSLEGKVHMPLDSYGFSTRFAWVDDQFGVSWQLNLGTDKAG
jgi:predicted 3-demethylubiquinone-9 3-methyltransferase (glyoxalase superfamily)